MTSRFKSIGFFFFAAVVFFLLAFFEKRISLVQSQVKLQNSMLEKFQGQTSLVEQLAQHSKSLTEQQRQLEEKIQVIALNFTPDSAPGDELVRDIIRQGLLIRHDQSVLWQGFIARCIRENRQQLALMTINSLKTLPEQVKSNWLETLKSYPSWDDLLLEQHLAGKVEQSEVSGSTTFLDVTKRLGFTVRKKDQESSDHKTDLTSYIKLGDYNTACTIFAKELQGHPQKQMLKKLCFAESQFSLNVQLD